MQALRQFKLCISFPHYCPQNREQIVRMNKNKQNPIAKNLEAIIKEANLHSEKKLKRSNLGRFSGTSTPLDITPNSKKEATQNANESAHAQTRTNKCAANETETKQNKITNSAKSKENTSNKKQRKRVWQKNSFPSQNNYVSIIDRRIDIKKLRGKSMVCIGGVRSGKSDFALAWANLFEGSKAFIATMQTPKDFEATQHSTEKNNDGKNTAGKKNKTKIEPSPQQNKNRNTHKNSEKYQESKAPSSLHSDRVKDMYRIHTRLDDEVSHFSYHDQVTSKFLRNDENMQETFNHDDFSNKECNSEKYNCEKHNSEALNSKRQKNKNANYCKEQKDQAFISSVMEDMKSNKSHDHKELDDRISKHRAQRGQSWITIEEPLDLMKAVNKAKEEKCRVAIIDCLTLWLTNLILQEKTDKQILNKVEELADLLKSPPIPLAIVTNEVGASIVPDNALARRFQDLQGKANQILAKDSSTVVISFCGLPFLLKG